MSAQLRLCVSSFRVISARVRRASQYFKSWSTQAWQPRAALGCRGDCQRIALCGKGKRRIQTDCGSHRRMRRVCLYQTPPWEPPAARPDSGSSPPTPNRYRPRPPARCRSADPARTCQTALFLRSSSPETPMTDRPPMPQNACSRPPTTTKMPAFAAPSAAT